MPIRIFSAVAFGFATANGKHPIRQSLVDRLNRANGMTWTAVDAADNPLASRSEEEIKGMMGLKMSEPQASSSISVGDIPVSYDAREKGCTGQVRDQASCGSCWAFAAAETLTDNLCALGLKSPELSAQDLVSCDSSDHACKGGTLLNVWNYVDDHGLVSQECMPYNSGRAPGNESIPACPLPGCSGSGDPSTHKCPVKHTSLDSDLAIQQAVMAVGAVEVGFFVMEDFMNYKSGIYKYQEGQQLGGHAVKIVGWGHDFAAGFYWIVQNSWGASWGESGYFRIVNWHEDKESAIAIGGGFACVQGPTPAPAPPPPSPHHCDDIASYCGDNIKIAEQDCPAKSYLIPVCQKTCGCCDAYKPAYCKSNASTVVV